MDAMERLNRARMSLGKAVSAKDRRDVSPEISSVVANLTAAKAKISDIETTEHELRAVLGQGLLAAVKRVNRLASSVPRPGMHSRAVEIAALVERVEETYAMIDVKVDEEAAEAIIANDPFIKAMDEADPVKTRASLAEIFADVDIDDVCDGCSVPPECDVTTVDPVIEVGVASMRPSDFPSNPPSGVRTLYIFDPFKDPSFGVAEDAIERNWFKRTG